MSRKKSVRFDRLSSSRIVIRIKSTTFLHFFILLVIMGTEILDSKKAIMPKRKKKIVPYCMMSQKSEKFSFKSVS